MEIKSAPPLRVENTDTAIPTEQRMGSINQEESNGSAQPEKTYTKEEIMKETEYLNKWLESKNSHLKFVLHNELNEYYVQVVNNATNEVIKEIPSKKIMDMVANIYKKLGLIVDEKV